MHSAFSVERQGDVASCGPQDGARRARLSVQLSIDVVLCRAHAGAGLGWVAGGSADALFGCSALGCFPLAAVLVSAGVADVAAAVNVAGDGAVVAPVDASQLPALESRPAPPTVLAPLLPGASDELPPTASKVDDPDALSGGDRESSFDAQRSVPVEGLTSPTQEVFKNPDSTYTARVSPNPVRFQDNKGEWIDIDLDFVADASGALRAKASGLPVVIAADGSKDLVQVGLAQGPVVMGVPDVARDLGRVEAKNGRAVFAAANESDPKVRVDLTVDGFEQDLVLAPTDGPSSYRLPFTLPDGVSAKQGATAVEFVDGAGVTVAVVWRWRRVRLGEGWDRRPVLRDGCFDAAGERSRSGRDGGGERRPGVVA